MPPGSAIYLTYPHLAHVDAAQLDEVQTILERTNAGRGRPKENGADPLYQRPKKRTRFPGQHARCWYCGRQAVWGANGEKHNLICAGARNWQCWNGTGFTGEFATRQVVELILREIGKLDRFDEQFAQIQEQAYRDRYGGVAQRREELEREGEAIIRKKMNLLDYIQDHGSHSDIQGRLRELDQEALRIRAEQRSITALEQGSVWMPKSAAELKAQLETELSKLAVGSFEAAELLKQLVPEFHFYGVRLLDGGHPLPRARVLLDLSGSIQAAARVPGLQDLLRSVHTIDLFEQPPQREQIREEAVALRVQGMYQRQIGARLPGKPRQPAVQRALLLDARMHELGVESPYVVLEEPPDDYTKQRRHKHHRYQFEPLDGYVRPPL
jgi:hypothetical protein